MCNLTPLFSYSTVSLYFSPGAYVPLTGEGNIVVDGVWASCYPSIDHELAHIGMTPIRWFPELIQWIFGDDKGLSAFARSAEELGSWMMPDDYIWGYWFQIFYFSHNIFCLKLKLIKMWKEYQKFNKQINLLM